MSQPNGLWCADYKGEFLLRNQRYCYPLTIADGYRRFLLGCEALSSTRVQEAKPVFMRVFKALGLPQRIRTANGVPFATPVFDGASEIEIKAMLDLAYPDDDPRTKTLQLTPTKTQVTLYD